jgi:hypothetical protein
MALFLGASLVTFLEVADLIARSGCRACTRRLRNRKHTRRKVSAGAAAVATSGGNDTNHVLFRSVVDVNDDELETTTSVDGGVSANHRNHQVNRGLQSAMPRTSSMRRAPTSPSSTSSLAGVPPGLQGGSGTAGSSPAIATSVGSTGFVVGLSTTLPRTLNDNGGHIRPTASTALVAALLSETDI